MLDFWSHVAPVCILHTSINPVSISQHDFSDQRFYFVFSCLCQKRSVSSTNLIEPSPTFVLWFNSVNFVQLVPLDKVFVFLCLWPFNTMQMALNVKILMPIVVPYMCVIEDRRKTILISERPNSVFGAKCIGGCLRPCSRHILRKVIQ